MKRFKIGKEYTYNEIQDLANNFADILTLKEYGEELIGEHFLVLKNQYDKTVSFVYTAYNFTYGGSYKCIYKDKL